MGHLIIRRTEYVTQQSQLLQVPVDPGDGRVGGDLDLAPPSDQRSIQNAPYLDSSLANDGLPRQLGQLGSLKPTADREQSSTFSIQSRVEKIPDALAKVAQKTTLRGHGRVDYPSPTRPPRFFRQNDAKAHDAASVSLPATPPDHRVSAPCHPLLSASPFPPPPNPSLARLVFALSPAPPSFSFFFWGGFNCPTWTKMQAEKRATCILHWFLVSMLPDPRRRRSGLSGRTSLAHTEGPPLHRMRRQCRSSFGGAAIPVGAPPKSKPASRTQSALLAA